MRFRLNERSLRMLRAEQIGREGSQFGKLLQSSRREMNQNSRDGEKWAGLADV